MAYKTIIIDGIKTKINEDVFDDYKISKAFAKIAEEVPEPGENATKEEKLAFETKNAKKGATVYRLIEEILGEEEDKVIAALEKKNKSHVTNAQMFEFLGKVIAANPKLKK